MISPLTFSDYAAQLREFIGCPSTAACTDADFNQLALSLFALQFDNNAPYRTFCLSREITPPAIEHWSRIPAIPTVAFKELELTSLPVEERTHVFHSSGTTEHRPSRHFHNAESLSLYEASLLPWFQAHLLPDSSSSGCLHFRSLTPPPELAPHSSLVHMFATLHREFGPSNSIFLGSTDLEGAWTLDPAKALASLRDSIASNSPVILLGTAFNFVQLLDHLEAGHLSLQLPTGSRVLETGGYKGRSRALPKPELFSLITQLLGIPSARIVSEYGMSELSSQAYDLQLASSHLPPSTGRILTLSPTLVRGSTPSPPLRGGEGRGEEAFIDSPSPTLRRSFVAGEGEEPGQQGASPPTLARPFHFPPWARAQIVSPETGLEVVEGETGLIRIFDLANVRSVMALQTEDLGIRRGDGFELLGRAALAEARGCSLMAI